MVDVSPTRAEHINVDDDPHGPRLNEISNKFIADCVKEKERLGDNFPLASLLIDEAIDRIHATGRIPGRELHADVFKQKIMKVTQKVYVPIKQFPKFNFNGKILGPRGNSLRALQKETLCRILIKGRHSTRDSAKEEELRQAGDPRHAHLNKDLFVEISAVAPPAEAYARVAYALAEIRKYLIPDSNDEVSQNQRKEILADPELAKRAAKNLEKVTARSSYNKGNNGGISILKKITGFTDQSFDDAEEEPTYYDDEERGHNNYAPTRHTAQQRQPMNRSFQEQSTFSNRSVGGRPSYGEQGNKNAGMSFLQKITGRSYDIEGDDNEQERMYDRRNNAEERGYNRNSYSEMRQETSQRPPMKRSLQEQSSFYQRRNEAPEKRTREPQFGEPSRPSRFPFLQQY